MNPLVVLAAVGGALLFAVRLQKQPKKGPVLYGTGVVATPEGPAIPVNWWVVQDGSRYRWGFATTDDVLPGFKGSLGSENTFATADAALADLAERHSLVPTTTT